LDRVLTCQV